MSDDTLKTGTCDEVARQLNKLYKALKATCHRPGCSAPEMCPEQCSCRIKLKGETRLKYLNIHTGMAWALAQEMITVANRFESWNRQSRSKRKMDIYSLKTAVEIMRHAASHHDRDNRIEYIMDMVYSSMRILWGKTCTERYDYGDKGQLSTNLERLDALNLRHKE